MTPEQMKELLPVAVAYAEGKAVERKLNKLGMAGPPYPEWQDYDEHVSGAFLDPRYEWCVKPEPREWWVCVPCKRFYFAKSDDYCAHCGCAVIHVREVVP